MNKSILIGRLTKDPEIRTTQSGVNVTNFTIAVNRTFTNANGERETDFINCIAFNKSAENIAKYTKKGSQLAVIGRIQTRSYDASDGSKRYVTEIVVEEFTFLGSKSEQKELTDSQIVQAVMNDENPFEDVNEIEITDDDLPF